MLAKSLVILAVSAVFLHGGDNSGGTWIRDIESSKSKGNTTKSATIVLEPFDGGVKYAGTIVKLHGAVDKWSFKIPYDGKNHAFRISDQDGRVVTLYDTVAIKQIDANQFEYTWLGPTLRDRSLVVVSEDGRTLTATDRREYHDGRIVNTKYVYRKQ